MTQSTGEECKSSVLTKGKQWFLIAMYFYEPNNQWVI